MIITRNNLCFISILIAIVSFFMKFELGVIISIFLILILSMYEVFKDIPNNVVFLFFSLMLLFFISGKVIIDGLFNNSFSGFSDEIKYKALLCIYISHISFYIGYKFLNKRFKINHNHEFNYSNYSISYKLLFIICIASSFAFLFVNLEKIEFVLNNGYLTYYTNFSSNIPSIILSISGFFYISFFSIICFPMSKKRKTFLYCIFIINNFITLFTGQRSQFGLNLLVISIILIIQNKEKFMQLLTKKFFIKLTIVSLLIAFLFQLVSVIRNDEGLSWNKLNPLTLIYAQGNSSNVIAYTILCENQLDNHLYSLATIEETINNNTIIKKLFHTKSYKGNSYDIVRDKSYLSYDLSYIILGEDYFKGLGLGTSYIAEIYKDFSYIGLFLFGIFLSGMCLIYNKFNRFNFFVSGILLNSLRYFLFLPRWDSLYFLVSSFQSMNVLVIFLLLLLSDEQINKIITIFKGGSKIENID